MSCQLDNDHRVRTKIFHVETKGGVAYLIFKELLVNKNIMSVR